MEISFFLDGEKQIFFRSDILFLLAIYDNLCVKEKSIFHEMRCWKRWEKLLKLLSAYYFSCFFSPLVYRGIIINSSKTLNNIFFLYLLSHSRGQSLHWKLFFQFSVELKDANFPLSKNEMNKHSKLLESSKRTNRREWEEKLMKFTSRHECYSE